MRCIVPNCSSHSYKATKKKGITYHPFPEKGDLLDEWLKSLRITRYDETAQNFVCSKHFNEKDMIYTKTGLRKIHQNAIPVYKDPEDPVAPLICRICFLMEDNMRVIKNYSKLFEEVTGILPNEDDSRLPQCICWECVARLSAAASFRAKAILSDRILHEMLDTEAGLKFSDLKLMKRLSEGYGFKSKLKQVTLDIDHFDINICDETVGMAVDTPKLYLEETVENMNDISNENENGTIEYLEVFDDEDILIDVKLENVETKHTDIASDNYNIETNVINNVIVKNEVDTFKKEVVFNENGDDTIQNIEHYIEIENDNDISHEVVENDIESTENVQYYETLDNENYDTEVLVQDSEAMSNVFSNDDYAVIQVVDNMYYEVSETHNENDIDTNQAMQNSQYVIINHSENDNDILNNVVDSGIYEETVVVVENDISSFYIKTPTGIPSELLHLQSQFTITALTQELQMQEIEERRKSPAYISASFKCDVCFTPFADKERLDSHIVKHNKVLGSYHCSICKIYKKQAVHMRWHMKMHFFEFACKDCDWVTRHRGVAMSHKKFHAGKVYTCPHCSQKFDRKTTYHSHLRLKHILDMVCDICGYAFLNRKGLRFHQTRVHAHILDNAISFSGPHCSVCKIRFLNQEAYDTHLRCSSKHLKSEDDPCRIRNDRGNSLDKAINRKRNIKCEQCGEFFVTIGDYRNHFASAHPNVQSTKYLKRSYICDKCGKNFPSKTVLDTHQWVHTGQKLHQCDICNKHFSIKMNLSRHKEIYHSDKKIFWECRICGKKFRSEANLPRHIKQCHSNERPCICEHCGKGYLYASELKVHIDFVHNKKPYPKRIRVKKKEIKPEREDSLE